jgi:hypothetical protein
MYALRSIVTAIQVLNLNKSGTLMTKGIEFSIFERERYMWLLVFICMAAVEMVTKPACRTARWTRNSSLELTTQ